MQELIDAFVVMFLLKCLEWCLRRLFFGPGGRIPYGYQDNAGFHYGLTPDFKCPKCGIYMDREERCLDPKQQCARWLRTGEPLDF